MCVFVTRCYKNNPLRLEPLFEPVNESKIVFWFGFMNEIKLLSSCEQRGTGNKFWAVRGVTRDGMEFRVGEEKIRNNKSRNTWLPRPGATARQPEQWVGERRGDWRYYFFSLSVRVINKNVSSELGRTSPANSCSPHWLGTRRGERGQWFLCQWPVKWATALASQTLPFVLAS